MPVPTKLRDPYWLDEHNALVQAKRGWFIANKNDTFLGAALLYYGEALEKEHEFLISMIRRRDRVIEVGANIGIHTVGLCHVAREVIAIEPQPAIHRVLCANLAINNISNVVTHAVGCGAESKTLTFQPYSTAQEHNSGGVALSDGPGIRVPIVRLDELTADIDDVRLIKIDVETMELDVLRGATGTIAKYRPLLYVENEMQSHCEPLVKWLRDSDYALFWHTPALHNHRNILGRPNRYGGSALLESYNMLCEPNESTEIIHGPLQPVQDAFHNFQGLIEVIPQC